jgi:uncharacterized protein YfaP (DUF2135 family)
LESAGNAASTYITVAALCIAAAIAAVFFAVYAASSGTEDNARTVNLSTSSLTDSFTINFDSARPVIIGLELKNASLPDNSFVDLDVEIIAPDGEEYYLFEQELWNESGYDEDGAWRESQYSVSEMFVPTTAGEHTLIIGYDGSVLRDFELEVTIRRNHIMPLWFIVYAVLAGLLGIGAWFMSATVKKV